MEEDQVDPLPLSRTTRLPEIPLETKVHFLSFLEQRDLLKAGRTSKSWRSAAEVLWKVKPLDLSNKLLQQDDYEALVNGPFCSLILRSVKLGKKEVSILVRSSRFIHLDFRHNGIGDEGVGGIAAASFPLLTALNLSSNNIGDEGMGKIAAAYFPLLTTLDLSENSIGDEGTGKIAAASFPLLTTLDLSYNRIGDEGTGKIAAAYFPLLTTLDLSDNCIGDEGVRKITAASFPLLTTLDLSNYSIGERRGKWPSVTERGMRDHFVKPFF